MKKLLLTAAAAVLLSSTAHASDNQFYVKGFGGVSKSLLSLIDPKGEAEVGVELNEESLAGFAGLGLGYHLTENWRFDLTGDLGVGYKTVVVEPWDVTFNHSIPRIMINGYYNLINMGDMSQLFIGYGIGVAFRQDDIIIYRRHNTIPIDAQLVWASALHLGVATEITDDLCIDIGYSIQSVGKVKFLNHLIHIPSFPTAAVVFHSIGVAVRYNF